MRGPRSSIRQYAGVLFLVIIRFSLAEKSCGVFAREKWRQRKRGAVGRLTPVNATRNVGRYLYPQKPYVLLLSRRYFHLVKKQLAGRFCALYDESKRKPGAPAAGRAARRKAQGQPD